MVERSGVAGREHATQEVGGVLVPALDHVGVDPKGGGGIRVA
jgi:hypothetical protein